MKFTTASLLLISSFLVSTQATPLAFNADSDSISVPIQVPFSSTPRVLTFPNFFHSEITKSDDDPCPQMPVQCVRDGNVIGDLGKQDFCRSGLTCSMCSPKKKSLDCNTKYIKECATKCEARGPLGGKSASVEQKLKELLGGDEGDICPDMKVSCKDKDGNKVGSIGKKPFCRDGVTCGQCHQTENSVECNAKFIKECKAQCEATGPLGGKSVFTYVY